jgi:hypothetical protein
MHQKWPEIGSFHSPSSLFIGSLACLIPLCADAGGRRGLTKVSPGLTKPCLSTNCGRSTPETALWGGHWPARRTGHLRSSSIPLDTPRHAPMHRYHIPFWASTPRGQRPSHLNPNMTPTKIGHREPMTINAFTSSSFSPSIIQNLFASPFSFHFNFILIFPFTPFILCPLPSALSGCHYSLPDPFERMHRGAEDH